MIFMYMNDFHSIFIIIEEFTFFNQKRINLKTKKTLCKSIYIRIDYVYVQYCY